MRWLIAETLLAILIAESSAQAANSRWAIPGGDAQRGAQLMQGFGCGACHVIPGIHNAHGNVGAPLTRFADRVYIAGVLRNNPDNLVRWLRDPQSIVPGNAMPNMGISDSDARALAAYLYTLH